VPVSQTNGISTADLSALEQRVYARLRSGDGTARPLVSRTTGVDDAISRRRCARSARCSRIRQIQNLQFARDIGDAFQRTNDIGRRMRRSRTARCRRSR
jgi:hypothetical protein